MTGSPRPPEALQDLREISVRFGSDPMHIQGAGGNASVKDGAIMWIKASGTLLADATDKEIFVGTDLAAMRRALDTCDPTADQPAAFLYSGGPDLRPSIETSLHAVFPQRVVLHTHCIHTLAHAVRKDARARLAERLQGFDWAFVDYEKPGAHLARGVQAVLRPDTNVVVLGNHGLIVAADNASAVADLQSRVHEALSLPAAGLNPADTVALNALAEGSTYATAEDPHLHQLALDPHRVAQVIKGSLYPDHVIFCGIAVAAVRPGETLAQAVDRITQTGAPAPVWLIVPGAGVLLRKDAGGPARVMMRCLADVMARVPQDAALNYLSIEQNLELLDWDAEKYRQKLNAC
ncbi:class II aldolase/adducin family protein [uncultured Roseobacter sp.]|uniref:class II aldolase/adducin family protein n=1 Tax=uncultured Roseobacter sp. TaxID=114847 RepID=UPI00261FA466|nr:class II aldolase/adducin family protein [uncultured Roseobacter sp.]